MPACCGIVDGSGVFLRVLLVEDDAMLGDAVHTSLAQSGADVQWVRDVAQAPSIEVVDAQHFRAALYKAIAEMRPDEASAAGHQHALLERTHTHPPNIAWAITGGRSCARCYANDQCLGLVAMNSPARKAKIIDRSVCSESVRWSKV